MIGVGVRGLVALRGRGWSPALQLRAARAWAHDYAANGGVASFRLDAARLDACPVALRWSLLTARVCASVALGNLRATGSNSFLPRTRDRLWSDVGATLMMSMVLAKLAQVHASVGLAAPLRRDRFAFQPEEFHRVAAVLWVIELGLGLRFP
jgi:hypothetical protein